MVKFSKFTIYKGPLYPAIRDGKKNKAVKLQLVDTTGYLQCNNSLCCCGWTAVLTHCTFRTPWSHVHSLHELLLTCGRRVWHMSPVETEALASCRLTHRASAHLKAALTACCTSGSELSTLNWLCMRARTCAHWKWEPGAPRKLC